MTWEADQFGGEIECETKSAVPRVEPDLAHTMIGNPVIAPAPDDAGERRDDIARKTHHLADLADRAAGAVANDGRCQSGPVATVLSINVLNDFLAPLVLEIDIDIGRVIERGADEALKQDVDAVG